MYNTATNVHNGHHFQPNLHSRQPPANAGQQAHHPPRQQHQNQAPRLPINVVGIPSVRIEKNHLVVGSSQTSSTRSYTPLKVLGDGSFGTVWLCDWHGTLPPNTPLSPMQCGAGAKPEWAGKRLVAVKRVKKQWHGGWDECQKLKEIESLRAIPFHPNIIPLYDFFLLPATKELYFVFESMEGNLYHLIKARKGRPLAGGLVASIFFQMVSGLDHIHSSGYFHRDMKPENVLVTTTGLFDYTPLISSAHHNISPERDVVAIIKLADFGLARETNSRPPYTQYVSTRWYRAPEVLLYSDDYSNPVDMWGLGTIMAELVNLRPLFPGQDQADQIFKICEVLGDPSDEYRIGRVEIGGGDWEHGLKLAHARGFSFPKIPPTDIATLFTTPVPASLIQCIRDLLKYDPAARLTSRQCLQHPYFTQNLPRNNIPLPSGVRIATAPPPQVNGDRPIANGASHRSPHHSSFPHPRALPTRVHPDQPNLYGDEPMDQDEDYSRGHPMDIQPSPMVQEYPTRPPHSDPSYLDALEISQAAHTPTKLPKFPSLSKGKKPKWFFGGGSHHNGLPPVQEVVPVASSSTPSLKRTQTSSSDSRSLREPSPPPSNKKFDKKEAERLHKEAERQRRALAKQNHRDQARAVMQKRNQIMVKKDDLEWSGSRVEQQVQISKESSTGPIRQPSSLHPPNASNTVNAAAGRFATPENVTHNDWRDHERLTKARRIDYDDDHSMSSSDVHSIGRMSTISFATIDSDPGPSRIRNRPSLFGLNRMQSASSLRTSVDIDFAPSARSSNSFSLEGQLAHDFRLHASVNSHSPSPLNGTLSPPPIHSLSLTTHPISPPVSPSPTWMHNMQQDQAPPYMQSQPSPRHPISPFDFNGHSHPPSPYGHPPSPAPTHQSDINPIFKVPPFPIPYDAEEPLVSTMSLPPFSELEAVAGAGYDDPPLSPMSFTRPDEIP